jgi:hypothetical protein
VASDRVVPIARFNLFMGNEIQLKAVFRTALRDADAAQNLESVEAESSSRCSYPDHHQTVDFFRHNRQY